MLPPRMKHDQTTKTHMVSGVRIARMGSPS
jgi:hypothetical protein